MSDDETNNTNTESGGDDGGDAVVVVEKAATGSSKRGRRRDDAFNLDLIFSRESMRLSSPLVMTSMMRDTHRGGTTSTTSRNNNDARRQRRQQKKFPFEPSPKRTTTKADDKNNSTLTQTTLMMMQKKPPVQKREEKKTPFTARKDKKRKAREEEEEEEEEEDAKDDDDTIENTDRRTLRTTTPAETTREKKIFGAARARTESEHPRCRRKDGKEASASIGVTTTTTRKTTTGEVKKEEEEEKKKEEDGSTRTTTTRAKRRRRCSDATTQEEVDGEKATTPATVFGRVFDVKDTLENASSKPSSSSSMVFDASKKTTTDDVARMKRKPATKSYKNFTKKKPPSRGESFPAFNVAAAVAKKKAQIEAAKVQEIGFGSSARKPAGIDPIPTTNTTTTTTTNTGGSIAKKKMKSLSSPFQGEHQQDPREEQEVVSEFQKMIQKARENLESSKAAADLCSPGVAAGVNVNASSPSRRENMHNIQRQKITTTTMLPSSTSKSFHQQQHRSANKMSSSFVAAAQGASAQKRGKHQRFASPPLRTTTTKGAAEEYHPQQQQQRRKEPVQQPPTRGLSSSTPAFPVNQAFVFAATNSNSQIIDIVAKATRKTYDPSTAEKAKRKAKDAYGKKRIEAHKKEKLGQLKDLDDVLSSKSSSFEASTKIVEDTTQTETKGGKPHFLGTTTTSSKDAKARRTNRVFGGAMTKAQKAHMAMEWEPL